MYIYITVIMRLAKYKVQTFEGEFIYINQVKNVRSYSYSYCIVKYDFSYIIFIYIF